VVIEPWLTDQWYVDAEKLAQAPIEAVRDGRIEIVPKTWEKTFFNWMENIQPWCVSAASCGGGTGFRLGMEDGKCHHRRNVEAEKNPEAEEHVHVSTTARRRS
jgi:hypothetical protein